MSKTHGTNVHTIDGKTYVEVERKAEVGEKVVIVSNRMKHGLPIGQIFEVVKDDMVFSEDYEWYIAEEDGSIVDYRVLEQVASEEWPPLTKETIELTANDIRWQPDKVIDLLANLARRVSSLEAEVKNYATHYAVNKLGEEVDDLAERIQRNFNGLETHLRDTQNNVVRQAEEMAEINERTQRKTHVTNAFPSNAKLLAEAFAALAKHESGGAR